MSAPALMDLVIYTAASDLANGYVTSKTDLSVVSDLGTLVFGDSEPLTLKFTTDAAGTAPAWLGDNTYSVNVSLGLRSSTGDALLAATNDFDFDTDTYSGHLQLSSADLASWINGKRAAAGYLHLIVSVTTPSDGTETFADTLVLVTGTAPAVGSLPDTPVAYATYADALAAQQAAETAASSASSSSTAATSAKNAAQAAQTGAELAETNAETAQAAAELAATTATTKAAEASASAGDADADRIAAQQAKTDAEAAAVAAAASAASITGDEAAAAASAAAALASEQAAAASEAAASASEIAAAASESAAAASASSAATSATTAVNAIADTFLGGIAGDSVPATATTAGDYYRITAAGTSQSITWAVGDAAIYNGTSGSWTQLSGYFAGQESITQQYAFLRAPAPQAVSDGRTSNRAMRFTPDSRGALAGASAATWAGFVPVPSSNPAATAWIEYKASTTTPGTIPVANSIGIGITATGVLFIREDGTTGNTDYRRFAYDAFRSTYSGQVVLLEVYFVNGTTSPVVYINGVDVSSSFALTTGGTPPDWLASGLVGTYELKSYAWPSGDAPLGCWINAALTDADRTYWLTHGQPPEWVLRGGSMAAPYVTDFSASTGWGFSNGATSIGSGVLNYTGGSDSTAYLSPQAGALAGQRVKIKFTVSAGCWFQFNGNGSNQWVNEYPATGAGSTQIIAAGTHEYIVTLRDVTTTNGWGFRFLTGGGATTMDDLSITALGALGYPVVGPDRFVRDATRLSPPIDGYMVGMRPASTEAEGWIRGRRTSSGYLQADIQLVGDGRGVTQVLMRSVSGGTASLGESAGSTATVVASLTLTAGVWTPCTILKSVVSGGKLYAALGTATDVEVAVRTGPILSLV